MIELRILDGRLGADTLHREIRRARIRHAHYARVGIIASVGESLFLPKGLAIFLESKL